MRPLHAMLVLSCLIGPLPLAGLSSQAVAGNGLIQCYDPARELVTRTRPDLCQGRAVSEAEAQRIRERRRDYVKESLTANVSPGVIGKRLIGAGTGFFVDRRGTLLTNAHVVKGCSLLTVSRPEASTQPAQLRDLDFSLDLALIDTELQPPRMATFAPAHQPMPDEITIAGYPGRSSTTLTPTLTTGAIPQGGTRASAARPLPLKANVQPGNSGGPVLDPAGRVIGVVFAAVDTKRVYQQTGQIVRHVGLAIPNAIALGFLKRNGIQPRIDDASPPADAPAPDLLEATQGYLARIECWL
ncbi:S1 family peptidase [Allochromatium palmeri]|uniref:Trypsin-like serine protease n=1 Tax=Allochromatium palmeri TaxID=231048 RepID=A0A6N8ECG0_9GAMM|nr:serine protease [Allochromatium palmeri]MTW21180.1 trypsin-like serine protease [Allochromatium palmeri]